MTLKEIQELIKLVAKTELSEFRYKDGDVKLHIRGKSYVGGGGNNNQVGSGPSIINVPAAAPAYCPDKGPYVKVGDTIKKGDTVCIVEAMKLFNEIESEVSGKIVKMLVEDASPIEYDQPLYLVDPS